MLKEEFDTLVPAQGDFSRRDRPDNMARAQSALG
jgi:hypothetical protein